MFDPFRQGQKVVHWSETCRFSQWIYTRGSSLCLTRW